MKLERKLSKIYAGDIASGKTMTIYKNDLKEIIENKKSFITVEAKNEYEELLKDKLDDYNIVVYDLTLENIETKFNPFEYAYKIYESGDINACIEKLEYIYKLLIPSTKNEVDPFWNNSARDYCIGITLLLFKTKGQVSFKDVMSKALEGVTEELRNEVINLEEGSYIKIFMKNALEAPNETLSGIMSVMIQELRLYLSRDKMMDFTEKSSLIELDKPIAVFINLVNRESRINELAPIIVDDIVNKVTKNDMNISILVDNLDLIPNYVDLCNIVADSVYDENIISYVIATRSLELTYEKYGTYLAKVSNIIKCK